MYLVKCALAVIVLAASTECWAQGTAPKPGQSVHRIANPTATTPEAALRKMHARMISAQELEFTTNLKIVDRVLGKSTRATVHYLLRKPNLLRVTATLPERRFVAVSDGHTLTIQDFSKRTYQQYNAHKSIAETMAMAAGLEVLQARMIEFFMNLDYLATAGENAEIKTIATWSDGKQICGGYNIKYDGQDWSVWVKGDGSSLPCRLVSKRIGDFDPTTQENTFSWNVAPVIKPGAFTFVAPKGYKKD